MRKSGFQRGMAHHYFAPGCMSSDTAPAHHQAVQNPDRVPPQHELPVDNFTSMLSSGNHDGSIYGPESMLHSQRQSTLSYGSPESPWSGQPLLTCLSAITEAPPMPTLTSTYPENMSSRAVQVPYIPVGGYWLHSLAVEGRVRQHALPQNCYNDEALLDLVSFAQDLPNRKFEI